ncbi:PAS domain-containing sensor histidine kinase [Halapricum hydrolyticum]|uniref:histidine kinase n=1 Tax=Halapricum hydrolyticum TaxID=2979991 RepID=A0AAE3IEP7_9EURY|nr:PAS domain S-box protein [Halapricum hydrolyticum]MCU4719269.1 PAS domain S-box protein [Halapricum hydrolyticum]MCU4728546.1 PAS domain S-box protein [Halapricum hydrolyticum]
MPADQALPGSVVVVDPDGRLEPVADAIGTEFDDVRTVEQASAVAAVAGPVACVLVAHDPGSGDGGRIDGIDAIETVRDARADVPVGVYALDQDVMTVARLRDAGADVVIRVPPERSSLLARQIRALAGVVDDEPIQTQFQSFLEYYPNKVYLKDRFSRFVNVTRGRGFEGTGLDRQQVAGLTDYELYERPLADELFEEEQRLLETGESIVEKIEHFVEDGESRWVSTTKVPRYDSDGELLGLVGNVKDVTSIKRQERAMATLHEASRRLVRTTSPREVGQTAVEIATEMGGLPRARVDLFDVEAGGLRTVAETDGVDWDGQSFQHAAATRTPHYRTEAGEFVPVEIDEHDHRELKLPDGIGRVCGLRLPLGDHGVLGLDSGDGVIDPFTIELAHVLASNVEAALDRAEQERQLTAQSERLEEFAALSSHELRNRLQIALGTAGRARAEDDLDAIEEVIETLSRMDRLVSQLLTLARTGSVSRSTEAVALSGVAETAWGVTGTAEMTLVVEDDAVVTADRDALLEVFEMLFRTIVDTAGSEHVRVGTLPDGFVLEDDASAVEPAELFEPTHSDGQPEGDSIYLVSAIADAHGWDIEVEPSDCGGTRFAFHGVDIAHVQ